MSHAHIVALDHANASFKEVVAHQAPEGGIVECAVPGLKLARITQPFLRTPVMYGPSLCIVAQGQKKAYLGDQVVTYDPDNYLVCSLTLPVDSEVPVASPDQPFLGAILKVDPQILGHLLVQMDKHVQWPRNAPAATMTTAGFDPELREIFRRLILMNDNPLDLEVLAPGLVKEALYRVLQGPQGYVLRESVYRDSSTHRVAKVVRFIEENYRENLDIDALAQRAHMSSSALHHHFKRATQMSPLQFVKKLRLHQARALLLTGLSAGETAFEVGYGSQSQFSREFRRLFGVPPNQLREAAIAS